MFNFAKGYPRAWPDDLKPLGFETENQESFDDWWERHSERLANLHPLICEQWVYRHFPTSLGDFLPLEDLKWRRENIPAGELLASVYPEFSKKYDPEFDYEQLHGDLAFPKSSTAEALDTGTWDYPIIVLHTPKGIISSKGVMPEIRLVLIEGHQRYRYLNALYALGKKLNETHELFILELTAPIRNRYVAASAIA